MPRSTFHLMTSAIALFALPSALHAQDGERGEQGEQKSGNFVDVTPYIEVAQVLTAQLQPGDDVVTYTRLAAGVDTNFSGRNNAGAVSLRYERQFGWGDNAYDSDTISGIARTSLSVIPRSLTFEAGAMAARTHVEGNGAASLVPLGGDDSSSQIYSIYAGPSLQTRTGDVALEAHYRLGYTRVEAPDALVVAPGSDPVDVFDESTVQSANVKLGSRPDELLPVGVSVGAGYYQEDISNLDQRVRDMNIRADVTVPLGPTLALVGGVGYEDVEISSRDAVRDALDNPVIGPDGRYVTDASSPRQLGYDVDGLIWDAGVVWRPSRRTQLEAHVGRRYGSTSFFGSFGYSPSTRSSLNVSVYDNVAGFGGQLNNALGNLPTQFNASRNPLTGGLSSCVASLEGGSCLGGVLNDIRSAAFRARGVNATYALDLGRSQAGIGIGYDQRKFIGAQGTVLEAIDGVKDENIWLAAYLSRQLDERSSLSTNAYINWFESGADIAGNTTSYGASAAYYRNLTNALTASAAVSLDGISLEELEDFLSGSAMVGLRYSF